MAHTRCPTTATAGSRQEAQRRRCVGGGGQVCDGAGATQSGFRGQPWFKFGSARARWILGKTFSFNHSSQRPEFISYW